MLVTLHKVVETMRSVIKPKGSPTKYRFEECATFFGEKQCMSLAIYGASSSNV